MPTCLPATPPLLGWLQALGQATLRPLWFCNQRVSNWEKVHGFSNRCKGNPSPLEPTTCHCQEEQIPHLIKEETEVQRDVTFMMPAQL